MDDGAAKAAPFDFKVAKSGGRIDVLNVFNPDKAGIFHGVGKTIASWGIGGNTDVVGACLTETFSAHVLVALFAVVAAKPAAFIAQEFNLLFLGVCECVQFFELLV